MFELKKTEGKARRGEFTCAHGTVQTPVFMNVGTQGAIKGALKAGGIVVGVLRKHYRYGSWGTVTSTDAENPESPVGTELQTVIADISSNDQLWNVTAELNKGYAAGSININGDMTIADADGNLLPEATVPMAMYEMDAPDIVEAGDLLRVRS